MISDYKLLIKYMKHVGDYEGSDFLDYLDLEEFSEDEILKLKEVRWASDNLEWSDLKEK